MKKVIIFTLIIVVVAVIIMTKYTSKNGNNSESITSFKECIEAGYPAMESYPRKCRTSGGDVFIENIGKVITEKGDTIRVFSLPPGKVIESPLIVEGEARGSWFFEGDFPIKLLNESGSVLATAIARSQGEWMTEEFVPFEVEIKFKISKAAPGTLVLEKHNPSNLPENADSLEIPIFFAGEAF